MSKMMMPPVSIPLRPAHEVPTASRFAVQELHVDAKSGPQELHRLSVDDLVKEVRAIEANLKRVGLEAKSAKEPTMKNRPEVTRPAQPVVRTRSNSPSVASDTRKPWGANTPRRTAAAGTNTPATQAKPTVARASPPVGVKRASTPTGPSNTISPPPPNRRTSPSSRPPVTPVTSATKKVVTTPEIIEHELVPATEVSNKVVQLETEVRDLREHNAALEVALRTMMEQHEQLRSQFNHHVVETREHMNRLHTQLQYATTWIQQVDYHAANNGAASEASEPEGESVLPIARRLDLSTESIPSETRHPPSPPMNLALRGAQ